MFYAFRTGRRIRIGQSSSAGHVFGGDGGFACYQGKRRLKCLRHVMTLRTSDPLVARDGRVTVLDGFRKLIPIYYDPENASDLQYLVSDEDMRVEVLRREEAALNLSFPILKDCGTQWVAQPLALEHISYPLMKALGWVSFARTYNLKLSIEDEAEAEKHGYPFHQWGGFFEILPNDWQFHSCANPKCQNEGGSLSLAGALFNGLTPEHSLVDEPDDPDEPFQMLIEVCGMCASVRTSLRSGLGEIEATPIE